MRLPDIGGIAQLARASALQAEGQGFESPHLHFINASLAKCERCWYLTDKIKTKMNSSFSHREGRIKE